MRGDDEEREMDMAGVLLRVFSAGYSYAVAGDEDR